MLISEIFEALELKWTSGTAFKLRDLVDEYGTRKVLAMIQSAYDNDKIDKKTADELIDRVSQHRIHKDWEHRGENFSLK